MRKVTGIVLLEGADSSGKSTLARDLVERFGGTYLHSTVRREIWRWHVGALRLALRRLAEGKLVILDRHWLSELVYGPVFRGAPAYDVGARSFDRMLRRFGAVTILCSPADQEGQVRRWAHGRETGKHEHFDRVREVIAAYADLRDGNFVPGAGYLQQLTRFGDFAGRDDVIVYDMDRQYGVSGRKRFIDDLVFRLTAVRALARSYRGDNLSGRWEVGKPSTLFVGEALSPATLAWPVRVPRWPWCDRDDHLSAATWLNRAVHHLALREDRIAFTNAVSTEGSRDHHDYLPSLLKDSPPTRVIALGKVAERRVAELGWTGPGTAVVHPQYHRRFHHGEGPEGYAKILEGAMR